MSTLKQKKDFKLSQSILTIYRENALVMVRSAEANLDQSELVLKQQQDELIAVQERCNQAQIAADTAKELLKTAGYNLNQAMASSEQIQDAINKETIARENRKEGVNG